MSKPASVKLKKDAKKFLDDTSKIIRYRGNRLSPEVRSQFEKKILELADAVKENDETTLAMAVEALRGILVKHNKLLKKASFLETFRSLGTAVLIALIIRAFWFEAFKIPTGSMIPTLLISDHIFVNKYAYGLRMPFTHWRFVEVGVPKPGEVFVFEFPGDGPDAGKDFIKRVIGVEGDRVSIIDNVIHINGKPIPTKIIETSVDCADGTHCKCVKQQETLGGVTYIAQHVAPPSAQGDRYCRNASTWPSDSEPAMMGSSAGNPDYPEVVVPPGHILAMGDNRDNSSDGRYWGFVPVSYSKGRAVVRWWPPGRWFTLVK